MGISLATENDKMLAAWMDFGLLEGTMRLGLDDYILSKFMHQQGCEYHCGDVDDDTDSIKSENSDDDDSDSNKSAATASPGGATKRKAHGQPSGHVDKRQIKMSQAPPRLPLVYRCRNTRDGRVYEDSESGFLQFHDYTYKTFTAKASCQMMGVGKEIEFTGRRVGPASSKEPGAWNDYLAKAFL
jgi:hypothetical protein